jgi:MFS family permease
VRRRPFLALVVVSFFVAIVHKFYFVLNAPFLKDVLAPRGAANWVQRISSLGQVAEILVMAVLALFIRRLGFKTTMLVGIAAYAVRCLVFALADRLAGPSALVIATVCLGQLLHGLCFGCFLAAAFMYLDRTTPGDLRGSVQNLYGTFVLGVGFLAGGFFAGAVGDHFTEGSGPDAVENWSAMWTVAAVLATLCLVAFATAFPKDLPTVLDEETADELEPLIEPASETIPEPTPVRQAVE